ncbi:MAG: ATP--guanido phosphotransferase, partial [Hominenteromicrobium sp.]
ILSCDEYMKLISNVRLGLAEGILSGTSIADINALTAAVQPATMIAEHGSNLPPAQRDMLRADRVRAALSNLQ